jgi:hypothetical protein
MKKLNPEELRGRNAEERFVRVVRSLKIQLPWIGKVRRTGPKLDRVGVDVSIFVKPLMGRKDIKIPVQIKSSDAGRRSFLVEYPESVSAGILLFVINEHYTDLDLRNAVKKMLEEIREAGGDSHSFFKNLDPLDGTRAKVEKPTREYNLRSPYDRGLEVQDE